MDETEDQFHPLLIDDLHRKLLRYFKGFNSKRKWANFNFETGLAHDSEVGYTSDGELLPSGHSSVRRDISLKGSFEGRWLPWGRASLELGFENSTYERSSVETYGYSSYKLGYFHESSFFRPKFYKYSTFGIEADYHVADSSTSLPAYFLSVRPSFKLLGHENKIFLKPDSIKLEVEFREYFEAFDAGILNESKDLTGIKLESLWQNVYECKNVDVYQNYILFFRKFESDAQELNYSTLAFHYKSMFEASVLLFEQHIHLEKNFGQEYNNVDRNDFILRLGLQTSANIYKKNAKLLLAFDWEDRQSDHSTFDYNHEIFYIGFQCHW